MRRGSTEKLSAGCSAAPLKPSERGAAMQCCGLWLRGVQNAPDGQFRWEGTDEKSARDVTARRADSAGRPVWSGPMIGFVAMSIDLSRRN
jgi:hypothetical protein